MISDKTVDAIMEEAILDDDAYTIALCVLALNGDLDEDEKRELYETGWGGATPDDARRELTEIHNRRSRRR